MATIEVQQEHKELFETLAQAEGLSVGDYLQKTVRTVEWVLREWRLATPEEEAVAQEPPPEQEVPGAEPSTPKATVGGKEYTARSWAELIRLVVTDLGPLKVFRAWPEDRAPILFTRCPEGRKGRGAEVTEGRHTFWLNLNFSSSNARRAISIIAESLGKECQV